MTNLISELLRLCIVGIIGLTIAAIIVNYIPKEYNFVILKKNEFQEDVISMINNGAVFEDIKHIYDSNKQKQENPIDCIMYILHKNRNDFYSKTDDSLGFILRDIKSHVIINKEKYENNFINLNKKLELFIKENNEKNPFEILETNQKDIFINLRTKLSALNYYDNVKNDIEKIVQELNQQNNTIKEYLSDATNSYYISIIALIFTFVFGIYPLRKKNG